MFAHNHTNVARATAPPASATALRAAIRISGPASKAILSKLIPTTPLSRGIHSALLQLTPNSQLPLVVLSFPAPNSYTGEDTAELLLPSNPHLIERVLAWLTSHDHVRLAQPGEFTARAFLRGKLTLEQAEGVAATIAAQSHEQLLAAKQLLTGATGREYRTWADELTMLLALVEAGIDFTDQEDVVPIAPHSLAARIDALAHQLAHYSGSHTGREADAESSFPLVALVGQPNSGKSTLFNALLGESRTIASPVAGTTRDAIIERLDLSIDAPGAGQVLLADLPGLDAAITNSPSDQAAQHAAHETLARADLLIWCDPTGRFDERTLPLSTRPTIRTQTFGDRQSWHGLPAHAHNINSTNPISLSICALDGWNLAALRRAIADHALAKHGSGIASLLPRHRRAIHDAVAALRSARAAITPHSHALANPENIAEHLRTALKAISELVGTISPDDVIGRVFASFCVGK